MFNSIRKVITGASLGIVFLLGVGPSARADLLDTYLTSNTLNSFEDNSREAYFDADGSGDFSVGDVLVGFLRVENETTPGAFSLGNTTYAVFSQQVTSIDGLLVSFGPTTVDGLTLSDLGVSGAETDAMIALYTSNYTTDLINGAPTDLTGDGNITLADYIAFIEAGTLELTAGIDPAEDDFFAALINLGFIPTTDQIAGFDQGDSIAFFNAALSIFTNNTNFLFADDLCANTLTINGCSDLTLVTGTVQGAGLAANGSFKDGSEFLDANGDPIAQCGSSPCGFIDNTDINLHPVPEPASMILFGLGLAGLGIYGRSRNRRKSE